MRNAALFVYLLVILVFTGCNEETSNATDTQIQNSGNSEFYDETEQNKTTAIEYINFLRTSSGLSLLTQNSTLDQSALNHSNYLSSKKVFAHEEYDEGNKYYTGELAPNRATEIGYQNYNVSENIATSKSEINSVDNLFTAIYHRFGFLDFTIDEIGFGYAAYDSDLNVYTYNMGSKKISKLCTEDLFDGNGTYYYEICSNENWQNKEDYDAVIDSYYNNSPDFVVFPYENATNIPPAFYSEIPDPLPDHFMTGNPISIQLNPRLEEEKISAKSFSLKNLSTQLDIDTIPLDVDVDPNSKFTNLQFAYFPVKRLDYNTTYEATVVYANMTYSWRFTTAAYKNFMKVSGGETLNLKSGIEYTIYFDSPVDASQFKSSESSSYSTVRYAKNSTIDIEFIDSMTYLVTVTGDSEDTFKLTNNSLDNGNAYINLIIE